MAGLIAWIVGAVLLIAGWLCSGVAGAIFTESGHSHGLPGVAIVIILLGALCWRAA